MNQIVVSDKNKLWKPTVTKLIKNFRDALISITPIMERSKIGWRDNDQGDAFDGIAESTYNWFVINNLENFIREKYKKTPTIPKYNFYYKDYSKISFIEVSKGGEDPLGYHIFSSLRTEKSPFDTVVCDKIDKSGQVLSKNVDLNFEEVKFIYHYRLISGELAEFDKIELFV